jgi:hypothetical protein
MTGGTVWWLKITHTAYTWPCLALFIEAYANRHGCFCDNLLQTETDETPH